MTELDIILICKKLWLNPAEGVNVIVKLENNVDLYDDGKCFLIPPGYEGRVFISTYDVTTANANGNVNVSEEHILYANEMEYDHVLSLKQKKKEAPLQPSQLQQALVDLGKRHSQKVMKLRVEMSHKIGTNEYAWRLQQLNDQYAVDQRELRRKHRTKGPSTSYLMKSSKS